MNYGFLNLNLLLTSLKVSEKNKFIKVLINILKQTESLKFGMVVALISQIPVILLTLFEREIRLLLLNYLQALGRAFVDKFIDSHNERF